MSRREINEKERRVYRWLWRHLDNAELRVSQARNIAISIGITVPVGEIQSRCRQIAFEADRITTNLNTIKKAILPLTGVYDTSAIGKTERDEEDAAFRFMAIGEGSLLNDDMASIKYATLEAWRSIKFGDDKGAASTLNDNQQERQ